MPTPAALRQRQHRARQIEADAEGFRARRAAAARARRARKKAAEPPAQPGPGGPFGSPCMADIGRALVLPLLGPEVRAQVAERKAAVAATRVRDAEARAMALEGRLGRLREVVEEARDLAFAVHARGDLLAPRQSLGARLGNLLVEGLDSDEAGSWGNFGGSSAGEDEDATSVGEEGEPPPGAEEWIGEPWADADADDEDDAAADSWEEVFAVERVRGGDRYYTTYSGGPAGGYAVIGGVVSAWSQVLGAPPEYTSLPNRRLLHQRRGGIRHIRLAPAAS